MLSLYLFSNKNWLCCIKNFIFDEFLLISVYNVIYLTCWQKSYLKYQFYYTVKLTLWSEILTFSLISWNSISSLTVTIRDGIFQPKTPKIHFLADLRYPKRPPRPPLKFFGATFSQFRFHQKRSETGLNQRNTAKLPSIPTEILFDRILVKYLTGSVPEINRKKPYPGVFRFIVIVSR